jgi:benzoyl-CoA reductase/2-hydroxyglutaryl-CoA dehydratase subunit BcrC/BadD/HgdB
MPTFTNSIAQLGWHYENPTAQAMEVHRAGLPVVGITSNTVPWELIRGAGFFPLVIRPARRATPLADEFMEENVFALRMRSLFDGILSGEWDFLRAVIIPRTSEQEYKLFLYLREVVRENSCEGMPPVFLYDLLHSRSTESHAYGVDRTQNLRRQLEEMGGRPIGAKELSDAVAGSNAARASVRRLLRLRQDAPRVSGAEALSLIGPYWSMDRAEYATLATEATEILEQRKPISGPRLMIKGASLDHRALHIAIEAHGAIVVAEDDWWGTRSAGADIVINEDPMKAIFESYYLDAPSPRVFPPEASDQWFKSSTARGAVDGVIFYFPPEDYVAGWDYPRHKKWLDEIGIRSVVVRDDADLGELSSESHENIARLIHQAATKH